MTMERRWKIVDSGFNTAEDNMRIDSTLLHSLSNDSECIIHFYDWMNPSATYGYFIDPSRHLCMDNIDKLGFDLAKRPTGGGIIFHMTDFAFSILVPASDSAYSCCTLSNYEFINRHVAHALQFYANDSKLIPELLINESISLDNAANAKNFCMAKPTVYDIIINGKKAGGAAQRRTKLGFLHQGSISIAMPDEAVLNKLLLPNSGMLEHMRKNTFSLLSQDFSKECLTNARKQLRECLISSLTHLT